MVASEPQMQTDEWTLPTKSHGPRWNGFLMSALRNNCSGRRQAKCSYCSQVFTHGKPERLFRHIKNACPEVPPADKARYLDIQREADFLSSTQADIPTSAVEQQPPHPQPPPPPPLFDVRPTSATDTEAKPSSYNPRKRMASDLRVQADRTEHQNLTTGFVQEETTELHSLLLKALLTSDVPLRLLENCYFQQYQRKLARSPYVVPRQSPMVDLILESLHTQVQSDTCTRLWDAKNLTLSLDGRLDPWGNAIYALLALKGPQIKFLIDILDIPQQQHSAENLLAAVKNSLQKNKIEEGNISAMVTDSRPIMVKFQQILGLEQPHVVNINCVLHVFNSIARDFLSHPLVDNIVESNKVLVEYFTANEFWRQHLETWQKVHGVKTGLQAFHSNRWLSLPKLCADVCANEGGFQYCKKFLTDSSIECPIMPESVLNVFANQDHFRINQSLATLLKPIIEGFERLQHYSVNLADVWKELIIAYQALRTAPLQVQFEEFREYCLKRLRVRSTVFDGDLYIMAFFLHPLYRRVVKRSLEEITRMILQYAKIWKFTRGEAISLREQLGRYYGNLHQFTYNHAEPESQSNALSYWYNVPESLQTSALKRLAVTALEIIPHADAIEGLLPIISDTRTSTQSRMSSTTLRHLCLVRYNLLQEMRNTSKLNPTIPDGSRDPKILHDLFVTSSTHIDNYEEAPHLPELVKSEKDSSIFTCFDFDAWQEVNVSSDKPQVMEFDENWELDEIFASFC